MDLIIHNQTKYKVPRTSIKTLFAKTLKVLKKSKELGRIELTIVSDQHIQKLNALHRRKDKITDVLSFAYPSEKSLKDDLIGEIIISASQAERQKPASQSLKQEMNKLFVHGLLHIFGFDHENDEDFYTMNTYEKRILESHS